MAMYEHDKSTDQCNLKCGLSKSLVQSTQEVYVDEELTQLNQARVLLDSVGSELLTEISGGYLKFLSGSSNIYEANGDHALKMISSDWCRHLNQLSRQQCYCEDTHSALSSGKWICHSACWQVGRVAIQTVRPAERICPGGIQLYALPIFAGDQVVGAATIGYGSPPRDEGELAKIAAIYHTDPKELASVSRRLRYHSAELIDMAKTYLRTSCKLIGTLVKQKLARASADEKGRVWEKIFEIIDHPIFIINTKFQILRANRAATAVSCR